MLRYKKRVERFLKRKKISFSRLGEDVIEVNCATKHVQPMPVCIYFDGDGEGCVSLKIWKLAGYKGKMEAGIRLCHELNSRYRWLKFFMDDEGNLTASVDAFVNPFNCGRLCLKLMHRIGSVVEHAYPRFLGTMWE